MQLSDLRAAGHVAAQYATPDRLTTRASVWRPGADGRDPVATLVERVVAALPDGRCGRVLEIGCGTGALAARVCEVVADAGADIRYLATDLSMGMARMSGQSAADAQTPERPEPASAVVDATALPFADGSFDVVVAAWMLYHVPDLERTLRECRRVLAPGGRLLAMTNGDRHTADLRALAGLAPLVTQFSRENGADQLSRHFGSVSRDDFATTAVCDYATALAYLRSIGEELPRVPAQWTGTRVFAGATSLFEAS